MISRREYSKLVCDVQSPVPERSSSTVGSTGPTVHRRRRWEPVPDFGSRHEGLGHKGSGHEGPEHEGSRHEEVGTRGVKTREVKTREESRHDGWGHKGSRHEGSRPLSIPPTERGVKTRAVGKRGVRMGSDTGTPVRYRYGPSSPVRYQPVGVYRRILVQTGPKRGLSTGGRCGPGPVVS